MPAAQPQRVSTRATGVVGVAVMCSRLLGLIREQVFAGLFGAGKNLDAFLMAFGCRICCAIYLPRARSRLRFITTFSRKIATEGDESAWRLGNKVATLTAVFMSAVTLLGIIFAATTDSFDDVVELVAEKTETTILLTRIMWPFILLVSLAALGWNVEREAVFGAPAHGFELF